MAFRTTAALSDTRAFLLARVDYGDADLIVHLFTEDFGKITSLARGARRSKNRYVGSLEPLHTLRLTVQPDRPGEFVPLRDAALLQPRIHLTSSLDAMKVAGRALRWVRKAAPAKTAEPVAFKALESLLDSLDETSNSQDLDGKLAAFGLRMLSAFGWGLQMSACIRCGRVCPEGRPAFLSPERGGLVCQACGGGPLRLNPELRRSMQLSLGDVTCFPDFSDVPQVLRVVERALLAHLGLDAKSAG